jgi:S-formylglutathione hydrolase FrmB
MKHILKTLLGLLVLSQFASSQTRDDFTLGGLSAFVIVPDTPAPGNPWIAYAPSISGLPEWHTGSGFETWMFDQYFAEGIAVAGIYSGDLSGSPAQRAGYTLLYDELVGNRGYAPRCVFHVRSRGGLLGYNWAADNPGKVAAIGGIFPVTNLLSYPGAGTAAAHYGISVTELTTNDHLYNPIERLLPLFNSGVKMFHIHGDSDGTVPLNLNSQITKDRYDALGGTMTLKVIPGGGHDYSTTGRRIRT